MWLLVGQHRLTYYPTVIFHANLLVDDGVEPQNMIPHMGRTAILVIGAMFGA